MSTSNSPQVFLTLPNIPNPVEGLVTEGPGGPEKGLREGQSPWVLYKLLPVFPGDMKGVSSGARDVNLDVVRVVAWVLNVEC